MSDSSIVNLSDRQTKLRLIQRIGALAGPHHVTVKRWRPRRSSRANAFYWACVVPALQQFLEDQGETYTADEIHVLMKAKFLRMSVVNKATGEVIGATVRSSASLDAKEFGVYLEKCIAWLAETFGIVVPDPREMFDEPKQLKRAG
jgi:hypothetical protein